MLIACACPFVDSVTGELREVGERWEVDDSRAAALVGHRLATVCAEQPNKPENKPKGAADARSNRERR